MRARCSGPSMVWIRGRREILDPRLDYSIWDWKRRARCWLRRGCSWVWIWRRRNQRFASCWTTLDWLHWLHRNKWRRRVDGPKVDRSRQKLWMWRTYKGVSDGIRTIEDRKNSLVQDCHNHHNEKPDQQPLHLSSFGRVEKASNQGLIENLVCRKEVWKEESRGSMDELSVNWVFCRDFELFYNTSRGMAFFWFYCNSMWIYGYLMRICWKNWEKGKRKEENALSSEKEIGDFIRQWWTQKPDYPIIHSVFSIWLAYMTVLSNQNKEWIRDYLSFSWLFEELFVKLVISPISCFLFRLIVSQGDQTETENIALWWLWRLYNSFITES